MVTNEEGVQQNLEKSGLTYFCISTVYSRIKKRGYNYEPRRKGYYVNGHEQEATVSFQMNFVK
jgi:hypothetical protein